MRGALLAAALVLVACDNSGGEAPAGTELAIESTGWGFIEPCFGGTDDAALLDSVEDVQAWMEPCGAPNDAKLNQIVNTMNALPDDKKLVAGRVTLGGCFGDWYLRGLYQDGDTIHVWLLKEDTSLNQNTGCDADIGWDEGFWIAAEGDVATATTGELHLGLFNPELPGAPASPGSVQ